MTIPIMLLIAIQCSKFSGGTNCETYLYNCTMNVLSTWKGDDNRSIDRTNTAISICEKKYVDEERYD